MGLLRDAQLRVAGDGPESALFDGVAGVSKLGSLSGEAVRQEMSRATALVVPSIWYENFPRTIVEAFACGLPVVASRIGALAGIVSHGENGLLFESGDPRDLAEKLAWVLTHPNEMATMGRYARAQYEKEFSAEVNYRLLIGIYNGVLAEYRREVP